MSCHANKHCCVNLSSRFLLLWQQQQKALQSCAGNKFISPSLIPTCLRSLLGISIEMERCTTEGWGRWAKGSSSGEQLACFCNNDLQNTILKHQKTTWMLKVGRKKNSWSVSRWWYFSFPILLRTVPLLLPGFIKPRCPLRCGADFRNSADLYRSLESYFSSHLNLYYCSIFITLFLHETYFY